VLPPPSPTASNTSLVASVNLHQNTSFTIHSSTLGLAVTWPHSPLILLNNWISEHKQRAVSVVRLEDGTRMMGPAQLTQEWAFLLLYEFKSGGWEGECGPAVQAGFSFSRWWSQCTVSLMFFLSPLNANPMDRHLTIVIPRAVPLFSPASRDLGCLSMEPACPTEIGLYNR